MTTNAFAIHRATSDDVADLHDMIAALARYEELSHLCVASEADLDDALFGPRPAAEALIARSGTEAAGFALFFHTYSTFLGRRSLWLEDLFVQPAHRRKGCAKSLLHALARLALDRDCGRFEWAVLDWNAPGDRLLRGAGGERAGRLANRQDGRTRAGVVRCRNARWLPRGLIVGRSSAIVADAATGRRGLLRRNLTPALGIQSALGTVEASDPAGQGDAR